MAAVGDISIPLDDNLDSGLALLFGCDQLNVHRCGQCTAGAYADRAAVDEDLINQEPEKARFWSEPMGDAFNARQRIVVRRAILWVGKSIRIGFARP